MTHTYLMALACAAVTLSASSALACQCTAQDVEAAYASSAQVYHGKVTAFDPHKKDMWLAKLRVKSTFKGKLDVGDEALVLTTENTKACGVDFRIGKSYMVFARSEKGALVTSTCEMTRKTRKAPMFPGIKSMVATPTGKGALRERTARAAHVFVGKVVRTGKPFAGSWHDVNLKVKITKSFKGERRGTMRVKLNEKACQKTRSLVSDTDLDDNAPAPVKKGGSYLFFTYDEEPTRVMTCGQNIVPASQAKGDIAALKKLCGKKRCADVGVGHNFATKARVKLKIEALDATEAAVKTCAKQHPLFGPRGSLSQITWDVEISPKGRVSTANLNVEGELEDGSLYQKAIDCMVGLVDAKTFSSFGGKGVLVRFEYYLKSKKSRPVFDLVDVQMQPAR